ncbi:MAG: DUF6249 domain-containing protein [Bacteroidota bacterium]
MGAEALIPIITSVAMFAMIFGIVYLRNKENMSLIERGINPRQNHGGPRPYLYLKYGLLMCGAGIGLLIAMFVDINMPIRAVTQGGQAYVKDNPAIYFAMISIFGGLGLVISYYIEKKELQKRKDN